MAPFFIPRPGVSSGQEEASSSSGLRPIVRNAWARHTVSHAGLQAVADALERNTGGSGLGQVHRGRCEPKNGQCLGLNFGLGPDSGPSANRDGMARMRKKQPFLRA
jgi:hypothetical protein